MSFSTIIFNLQPYSLIESPCVPGRKNQALKVSSATFLNQYRWQKKYPYSSRTTLLNCSILKTAAVIPANPAADSPEFNTGPVFYRYVSAVSQLQQVLQDGYIITLKAVFIE